MARRCAPKREEEETLEKRTVVQHFAGLQDNTAANLQYMHSKTREYTQEDMGAGCRERNIDTEKKRMRKKKKGHKRATDRDA
jgi:uncharacterized protein YaiI (UPF0178 family)